MLQKARALARPLLVLTLTLSCALALPRISAAAEIEGISFPDQVRISDQPVPLFGLGLLRYRVLFRGYVGGLYLPAGTPAKEALENVPKALELHYFWDIEARFFGEAANELLARKLPPARLAGLRDRLDRLHALYEDVKAGDRYRLTYEPAQGMTLALNGRPLGTISGADFAADYFGIWLGDEPLSESFRDQLFETR